MTGFTPETVIPVEDVGALTAARYRYQAEVTAQHCLAMLLDDSILRVVCEWHEDYIVVFRTGETALVSVKHLEDSQPRWTIRQLCDAGGLAHLFTRWRSTGEESHCLLRTNAGLRTGDEEAEGLRDCCVSQSPDRLDWWSTRITEEFRLTIDPELTEDETRRFLTNLRIEAGLPNRTQIAATNLVDHVPPVLAELGYNPASSPHAYEAVVAEVSLASRSFEVGSLLRLIAMTLGQPEHDTAAVTLQARTIDRDRLLHTIAGPTTRRSQTRLFPEVPDSAMFIEKLTRGGFGPTAINNARNLRINWEQHRISWSTGFPQHDEVFQIAESAVLSAASRAENATRDPESAYGVPMHDALLEEIAATDLDIPGSGPVDPNLLLGCAYDLTAACRIWWSDEFEPPPDEVPQ